jgi:hypothetical protein
MEKSTQFQISLARFHHGLREEARPPNGGSLVLTPIALLGPFTASRTLLEVAELLRTALVCRS